HPDAHCGAPGAGSESPREQARDVMDLMRAINGYAFLICACGLKIKVPPDFKGPHVSCPRCKRENQIPRAAMTEVAEAAAVVGAVVGVLSGTGQEGIPVATAMTGGAKGKKAPLQYTRRTKGWESFSCMCGNMMQLSPAFSSRQMKCRKCGRMTRID
ncbi:MAG: hypothetical protein IH969_10090, partial [Candidatus Krumholzibacteriota bacterium]|nr:hypothetical protein [Candidatus Krumholzibacteriota bacterium]